MIGIIGTAPKMTRKQTLLQLQRKGALSAFTPFERLKLSQRMSVSRVELLL